MTAYLLEHAWVDGAVRDDVLVEIEDGRFSRVEVSPVDRRISHLTGTETPVQFRFPRSAGETSTLPGLTLPGFANTHSHAFHRALRGHTQGGGGTFWTWREQMYAVAAALDPPRCFELARATYREMAAAGFTAVGEFHYLHHRPDGTGYDDPNAMADALVAAAREAGVRITLLDTAYLSAGFGDPPTGVQVRYSDGDAAGFARRSAALADRASDDVVLGTAIHSVRAVAREDLATVARVRPDAPLHVHLSEQPAENDACRAAYGVTPARLLADAGVLGPRTTAVHATHLTDEDVALLGDSRTRACLCPTTERDLADGIGPARALADAGSPLALGSDSHAVTDPFEEMRGLELHERLATGRRGQFTPTELLAAATHRGHAALGFPDAGQIAVGERADLVTVATGSPRTAGGGADAAAVVFAATAADVTHVVSGGRVVARREDHEEIGRELAAAIAAIAATDHAGGEP